MKYLKRALMLGVTGALVAAVALPATASARAPRLGTNQALRAGAYALNHWQPWRMLPRYSRVTAWDDSDPNGCTRFGMYHVKCIMDVDAKNYYYDYGAGMWTGYAWCVGVIDITKNPYNGRIRVSNPGFHPFGGSCGSTHDYD